MYTNGKIYVIRNEINMRIYVGATTQSLAKRMSWHRNACRNTKTKAGLKLYVAMREIGIERFHIELLENCPCDTKEQLTARGSPRP